MQNKTIDILSTRPVAQALIEEARAKGISVDIISFIETSPIINDAVIAEIKAAAAQKNTVVFTSMNAVEAVMHQLDNKVPDWAIFCMGNTTRKLVQDYFGKSSIFGIASSASELAQEIVAANKDKNVLFFCGNERRDELPEILHKNNIGIKELVVYNTIKTTMAITKNYDGILFFSPSAVHSFFVKNKLEDNTVFFAIGETTANAIKEYSANKIVISNTPAKDELLKQAVEQFRII